MESDTRDPMSTVILDWAESIEPSAANTMVPSTFFVVPIASFGASRRASCSLTRYRATEPGPIVTDTPPELPTDGLADVPAAVGCGLGSGTVVGGGATVGAAVGAVVGVGAGSVDEHATASTARATVATMTIGARRGLWVFKSLLLSLVSFKLARNLEDFVKTQGRL